MKCLPIIPLPNTIAPGPGACDLQPGVAIRCGSPQLTEAADSLRDDLAELGIVATESGQPIDLTLAPSEREAYELEISPGGITIQGDEAGVFYGVQSLRQLLMLREGAAPSVPCCRITDRPRFSWRGYMLDESRHFFGKEYVKKLLDWMALLKLNRFHWHLTDEPAWRIEIRKYPKLAEVGGRGCYSDPSAPVAFYTQDDIRDIVEYARRRHIVIVPEIDMPGHATAANRAYPEFSGGGSERCPDFTFNPGNEATYAYLEDILSEVADLFPGPWLHLGGDEVHFGNEQWNRDKHVQALMAREGIETLKDVEFHFIRRMSAFLKSLGKTCVGWDEIVDSGVPADQAVVMWWRHDLPGMRDAAFGHGFNTILCPRVPCYFDFVQHGSHDWGRRWQGAFGTVDALYGFPTEADIPVDSPDLVMGIQGNLWTERVRGGARADFMSFPRLQALAEAGWTDPGNKGLSSFHQRIERMFPLMKQAGIAYFDCLHPAATPEIPGVDKATGAAALEEEIQAGMADA